MAHYEIDRFGDSNYIVYEKLKDFNFPTHFHRSLEFIYVYNGEMEIFYDKAYYPIKKDEAALFLPYDIHGFKTASDCNFVSIIFSPELVFSFVKKVEDKEVEYPIFKFENNFLESELLELEDVDLGCLQVKGLLYYICGLYLKETQLHDKEHKNDSIMHKIVTYLTNNFKEQVTLDSLSKAIGYDKFYISRYISKNMSTTFHKYLTQLRLSHATQLLCSTDQSIIDIALKSGYSNIRSFNSAFKREFFMSPSDYIKSKKKE